MELILVRQQDGGLTPPTEKPQPWAPNIDDSPRSGCRPIEVLPLLRNQQQLLQADATVGLRAETSRNPQEFIALDRECCRPGSMRGAVLQIAVPFRGEWCVLKTVIDDVTARTWMIHSDLQNE
jgi:hypothetical protein